MRLFLVIPSFLQDAFKTLAYPLAGVGGYSRLVALPCHLGFLTRQRARRETGSGLTGGIRTKWERTVFPSCYCCIQNGVLEVQYSYNPLPFV